MYVLACERVLMCVLDVRACVCARAREGASVAFESKNARICRSLAAPLVRMRWGVTKNLLL